MKSITALIFIAMTFFISAQLPADTWFYGTWLNQGYSFEGSFYPANSWNEEKLVLNEDYSLLKAVSTIENHQVQTTIHPGKWTYDAKSKQLQVYSDEERYSPQGKVILLDKEYALNFSSKNYFTVKEQRGNYLVTTRFQREGTTESFEESEMRENARLADLALKYDTNSAVFYIVNSLVPTKKKVMYFDNESFNFSHSLYNESSEIERRENNFTGKIKDFTDSSIIVSIEHETIDITYVSGLETAIDNNYYFSQDGFVTREFKYRELDNIYSAEIRFTESLAPITFTVSAITALIVAPLISINYKTGDFNKDRYYKTAGIGLIGVGASIPLAIIFSRSKPMRFIPLGEDEGKNNWYLQKVPR